MINMREVLHFTENHSSPLLSCCIDDGEHGIGWYVDITDRANRQAMSVGFFKSKEVAMAVYKSLERRFG